MSGEAPAPLPSRSLKRTVRLLQDELAQTNREVLALTLELETRMEQVRAAEERYRRLAENAPDIIYRFDLLPVRGFTFVNDRTTAVTGYPPAEYYADPDLCLKMVHPEDRSRLEPVLRGERDAGRPLVIRWRHKDGSLIWIEQQHTLVKDASGAVIAVECIARDITARKNLEEQFRQSQKMEAVGRLAGGVAHDFNNLLTVINGYAEQALFLLQPNDSLYHDIQEISKAGDRAAALTHQLLAFSRRQVLQPRLFDLNTVVAEMNRMLRRLVGEDVAIVTVLAPGLPSVFADRGGIEQALLNLVVNARDAMPQGGKLIIETAEVELQENYTEHHRGVTPGAYVMLAVSDTGLGMDEATQARMFEPFFTTKPEGKGTGIGLSTVYGIVQQSGGSIWVYSESGRGTTFKIYLPVAEGRASDGERRREVEPAGGSETVVVVDDEAGVRQFVGSVLKKSGYNVLEAAGGAEALELCRAYPGAIHLLLTDVVMPEISGPQLAGKLTAARPGVKVLFMSGYTGSSVAERGVVTREARFLQKPFTPTSLAAAVREALDALS